MILFIKKNLLRLLLLVSISLNLIACGQTKKVVVRSYSFYVETTRGNFPEYANEDVLEGNRDTNKSLLNKIDTSIIVYVETKSKFILWDTAWQKGQAYVITALPMEGTNFNAGTAKGGSQVIITAAKENFLWQLQLSPLRMLASKPIKVTKEEVRLKGRYNGKPITWKTKPLIELIPLPSR